MTKTYDIEYKGWAPCAHGGAPRMEAARRFIDEVIAATSKDYFGPTGDNPIVGGQLELLLWELNSLGGCPHTGNWTEADAASHHQILPCDLWVRVDTIGEIAGKSIRSMIQGDTFLLAMAASVHYWREKTAELTEDNPL